MKIREPETLAEVWGDTGGEWRRLPTSKAPERDAKSEVFFREKLSRCSRKSFKKISLPKLKCLEQ